MQEAEDVQDLQVQEALVVLDMNHGPIKYDDIDKYPLPI